MFSWSSVYAAMMVVAFVVTVISTISIAFYRLRQLEKNTAIVNTLKAEVVAVTAYMSDSKKRDEQILTAFNANTDSIRHLEKTVSKLEGKLEGAK